MHSIRKALRNEWKQKFEQYRSSGKTVSSWCQEQGITYHMFYYWRKKLGPPDSLPKLEVSPFLEIIDPISDQSGLTIEFQDVKINLSKKFDPSSLIDCLQALRRSQC